MFTLFILAIVAVSFLLYRPVFSLALGMPDEVVKQWLLRAGCGFLGPIAVYAWLSLSAASSLDMVSSLVTWVLASVLVLAWALAGPLAVRIFVSDLKDEGIEGAVAQRRALQATALAWGPFALVSPILVVFALAFFGIAAYRLSSQRA